MFFLLLTFLCQLPCNPGNQREKNTERPTVPLLSNFQRLQGHHIPNNGVNAAPGNHTRLAATTSNITLRQLCTKKWLLQLQPFTTLLKINDSIPQTNEGYHATPLQESI